MFQVQVALVVFILLGVPYALLLKKAGLSPYGSLIFLLTPFGIPLGAWLGFPILALRAWPARNELPNKYFLAIPQNITLMVAHMVMPILSLFVIFKKSGYSGWWCLTAFVPPVALVMLWVFALKKSVPQESVNA
ncbi:hypothetical protein ACQZ2G_12430 [Pseudomonas viridiflava]|uniref:hypothetical protein n=1 Tax=Pseudomonas viridiflava TaxID=33069 RepID=UPI000F01E3BE|nr:hypothetical protein [Pseudomonas viridiflava]MEE4071416.1 hypothetical protein [Pseudomonas viridiflava]